MQYPVGNKLTGITDYCLAVNSVNGLRYALLDSHGIVWAAIDNTTSWLVDFTEFSPNRQTKDHLLIYSVNAGKFYVAQDFLVNFSTKKSFMMSLFWFGTSFKASKGPKSCRGYALALTG